MKWKKRIQEDLKMSSNNKLWDAQQGRKVGNFVAVFLKVFEHIQNISVTRDHTVLIENTTDVTSSVVITSKKNMESMQKMLTKQPSLNNTIYVQSTI